jgi:hypothetical protein
MGEAMDTDVIVLVRDGDLDRKPMLYACPKCGSVHSPKIYLAPEDVQHATAREAAANCYNCRTHDTCRHCGCETPKGWLACRECRDAQDTCPRARRRKRPWVSGRTLRARRRGYTMDKVDVMQADRDAAADYLALIAPTMRKRRSAERRLPEPSPGSAQQRRKCDERGYQNGSSRRDWY